MTGTLANRNSAGKGSMALAVTGIVALASGVELCRIERISTNLLTGSVSTSLPYLGIGIPLILVGLALTAWGATTAKRNLRRSPVPGFGSGPALSAGQTQQGPPTGTPRLGGWKCSQCGTSNNNNRAICWSCEAPAPGGPPAVAAAGNRDQVARHLTCPNGHRVPDGFAWCRQCGARAGVPTPEQGR